jgi:hypothetical protein
MLFSSEALSSSVIHKNMRNSAQKFPTSLHNFCMKYCRPFSPFGNINLIILPFSTQKPASERILSLKHTCFGDTQGTNSLLNIDNQAHFIDLAKVYYRELAQVLFKMSNADTIFGQV